MLSRIDNIVFSSLLLLMSGTITLAQTVVPGSINIATSAISDGNHIIVRWAPLDISSWNWGNDHGYLLERITVEEGNVRLSTFAQNASLIIVANNLLPLSESDWEQLSLQDDMAGVAAAALYSENFDIQTGQSDIMTAYNLQQESENRFGFSLFAADQSTMVAEGLGLFYIDNTVEAGKRYAYRAILLGLPDETPKNIQAAFVSLDDILDIEPPFGLQALAGDQVVQLNWGNPEGVSYTSFDVYRTSPDGTTVKANQQPLVAMSLQENSTNRVFFSDSLDVNGQTYSYQVVGKTIFGVLGPYSDPLEIMGVPPALKVAPFIQRAVEIDAGEMFLEWSFPESLNDQIQSFILERSILKDGPYEIIGEVKKADRNFTDENPKPTNYYRIIAMDNNRNESPSVRKLGQLSDDTPPPVPDNLGCSVNSIGSVELNWAAVSDDGLMGYRVFTCNQLDGEYAQLTRTWTADTSYYHTINLSSLTEEVYFKILSLDQRENYSDLSAACTIQRPDIIPPATPVLTQAEPRVGSVFLAWKESSSNDVVRHTLQRKQHGQGYWMDLFSEETDSLLEATLSFLDETASYDEEYDYRILAEDDAALISSSIILTTHPIDDGIRAEIGDMKYEFRNQYHNIRYDIQQDRPANIIYWEYPHVQNLHSFQIFRSTDDGGEQLVTFKSVTPEMALYSLDANATVYVFPDIQIAPGHSYYYRVQAKYIDDATSPLSTIVNINL